MKHPGCTSDFSILRNRELMAAFRATIATMEFVDIEAVSALIVEKPCSRFWVSEERATAVVSAIIAGQPILYTMRPTKREMFLDIYNRVKPLRDEFPNKPLCDLVFLAVNSPAPKFYMQPSYAMKIIYKILNKKIKI